MLTHILYLEALSQQLPLRLIERRIPYLLERSLEVVAAVQAASEVFADRAYDDDGSLAPRGTPGAMVEDVDAALAQVRQMLAGSVRARSGRRVELRADTLCLHGDQPGALHFAGVLRAALSAEGVILRAPGVGVG